MAMISYSEYQEFCRFVRCWFKKLNKQILAVKIQHRLGKTHELAIEARFLSLFIIIFMHNCIKIPN